MKFIKMEGLGNDYVYVDLFSQALDEVDMPSLSRRVSDRHFGIGSDGLILIGPSDVAHCRMRMYNSDGSEAELCGNGVRCIAKLMHDWNRSVGGIVTIETRAGIISTRIVSDSKSQAQVAVDMGKPSVSPSSIPVSIEAERAVSVPLMINGRKIDITCVSMGNPHCVIFVDSITDDDVLGLGPLIENHPLFPKRTNVEFVEVKDRKNVTMRVWERGAGETLACGTGACATAVAASLNHLCENHVNVELVGGTLEIILKDDGRVEMIGPATIVFTGEIEI